MPQTTRQLPPNKGLSKPVTTTNKNQLDGRPFSRPTLPPHPGLYGTPPFTIAHYGPPGVGKTSLWAFLPDVGYMYDSKEEGIIDLFHSKQVPEPCWHQEVKDFEQAIDTLADIANQKYSIKSLVLDSLTGFETLCFQYHCREYFDNNWSKDGFYAFQQGPKNAAKTDWPRLLDALDEVRKSGVNVIFIGHSQIKQVVNPAGADYDQYVPILDKETWAQTSRWAKAVLFQNYDIALEKKGAKYKAVGGEGRLLYTSPAASYVAKNRWGLEPVIDLGGSPEEACKAFLKAYRKAWNIQ